MKWLHWRIFSVFRAGAGAFPFRPHAIEGIAPAARAAPAPVTNSRRESFRDFLVAISPRAVRSFLRRAERARSDPARAGAKRRKSIIPSRRADVSIETEREVFWRPS